MIPVDASHVPAALGPSGHLRMEAWAGSNGAGAAVAQDGRLVGESSMPHVKGLRHRVTSKVRRPGAPRLPKSPAAHSEDAQSRLETTSRMPPERHSRTGARLSRCSSRKAAPASDAGEHIDALSRHLPDHPSAPACFICHQQWPCEPFRDAAGQLQSAGLRLADFVPTRLHERLWPQSSRRGEVERAATEDTYDPRRGAP